MTDIEDLNERLILATEQWILAAGLMEVIMDEIDSNHVMSDESHEIFRQIHLVRDGMFEL